MFCSLFSGVSFFSDCSGAAVVTVSSVFSSATVDFSSEIFVSAADVTLFSDDVTAVVSLFSITLETVVVSAEVSTVVLFSVGLSVETVVVTADVSGCFSGIFLSGAFPYAVIPAPVVRRSTAAEQAA